MIKSKNTKIIHVLSLQDYHLNHRDSVYGDNYDRISRFVVNSFGTIIDPTIRQLGNGHTNRVFNMNTYLQKWRGYSIVSPVSDDRVIQLIERLLDVMQSYYLWSLKESEKVTSRYLDIINLY